MSRPGYQEGGEPVWWWKVALHLDEAQIALANAMAHNVDDPRLAHALYDRLREGQAILLEIFRAKGLLPEATNGRIQSPMPGVPMPGVPVPTATDGEVVAAVPTDVEQTPSIAAAEPAVPEADQAAAGAESEQPATVPPPEVTAPAAIATEPPTTVPLTDPGAGGVGG